MTDADLDFTSKRVRRDRVAHLRGVGGTIARWWAAITEPRHMSVIYGGVYTVALLTGIATLGVPPQTIAGELGPVLSAVWAVLFILGGSLGMIAVLPGWWKWERWGAGFVLLGIGLYGFVIVWLHLTTSGSRLTQLGVLLLGASVFIVRLVLIWGRTYGPRR